MRKLLSKWLPRLLTPDHVGEQTITRRRFKALFEPVQARQKGMLHRYVTTDETWIHYCTPESKRPSAEWTAACEVRPKRPKTQKSAGKIMASLFWDVQSILFIDYLENDKTTNSEYYVALLDRMSVQIKKKRPHMQKKFGFSKTMPRVSNR